MLAVCRLICDRSLMGRDSTHQFQDFRRDEKKMRTLFEKFVHNFYARHTGYRVSAPTLAWDGAADSPSGLDLLPGMRTDIVLASKHRTIVVDTKFTEKTGSSGACEGADGGSAGRPGADCTEAGVKRWDDGAGAEPAGAGRTAGVAGATASGERGARPRGAGVSVTASGSGSAEGSEGADASGECRATQDVGLGFRLAC